MSKQTPIDRPQTFVHVFSKVGLELSDPTTEVLVWSLKPNVLEFGGLCTLYSYRNRLDAQHRERDLPARFGLFAIDWFVNGEMVNCPLDGNHGMTLHFRDCRCAEVRLAEPPHEILQLYRCPRHILRQ